MTVSLQDLQCLPARRQPLDPRRPAGVGAVPENRPVHCHVEAVQNGTGLEQESLPSEGAGGRRG